MAGEVRGISGSANAKALRKASWNVSQAARDVGMARPNLHALMRKHGITTPDDGDGEGAEETENGANG